MNGVKITIKIESESSPWITIERIITNKEYENTESELRYIGQEFINKMRKYEKVN